MRIKCSCISCRIELQPRYLKGHRCKEVHGLECPHCSKEFATKNSCAQHAIRCVQNQQRIQNSYTFADYNADLKSGVKVKQYHNQFHKKAVLGDSYQLPAYRPAPFTPRTWTAEEKERHSLIMSEVARSNPDKYNSSNRGRTKKIERYGTYFHGSWELCFYEACLQAGLPVQRCSDTFDYVWESRQRSYNPDFYLPTLDKFVEVKGYETLRDRAKWASVDELIVLRGEEIKQIRSGRPVLEVLTGAAQ